jgi:putative oxidoreductase
MERRPRSIATFHSNRVVREPPLRCRPFDECVFLCARRELRVRLDSWCRRHIAFEDGAMDQLSQATRLNAWALLPLRLVVGYGFFAHGMAKWTRGPEKFAKLLAFIDTPHPALAARVVTGVELLGGIAIMLGAFVVLASIPLAASMLVAMFSIHVHYGFSAVNTIGLTAAGPVFGPPGYEINLLYLGALVALTIAGPGALSVQGWLAAGRRGR